MDLKIKNLLPIRTVLSILRVIDIQSVFVTSQEAAAWRRGWFSGLLPVGLRAPRTGQDGHKCHEGNRTQGGEKCTSQTMYLSVGVYDFVEPKLDIIPFRPLFLSLLSFQLIRSRHFL